MSGGRGVRGNREVSPLFLLGGGGGRIATTPEATSKEGGSWGKHGFPHASEPKASDGHARTVAPAYRSARRRSSLASGQSAINAPPTNTKPASQSKFTSGFCSAFRSMLPSLFT